MAALLAALPLLGSCETSRAGGSGLQKAAKRDVAWLVDHGEYVEALRLAEANWREDPDDAKATEEYRIASVALLMGRARMDLFADRDEQALEGFLRARELAPEQQTVEDWVQLTRHKLARRLELQASELHIADDLHGAVGAYEQALDYDPQNDQARHGLARALLQLNHRRGMGESYYEDGIEALDSLWLQQASSSFSYSLKYTPEDPRTSARRKEVQQQLAIQRVTIGQQFEAEGRYAAARNEFRMALLLDDSNPIALGGLARMTVEAEAADLLRDASQAFLREDFDKALAAVDLARSMSSQLDDQCDELAASIVDARLGRTYDRARVLESDQRFPEAIVVYGKLLESAPYFRDAIARRDTLEDYVAEAGRLYDEAATAETPEEEVALLRRIAIFWPEYRDVAARLARLEGSVNG